ncbi:MAG: DoxX family protein [Bacteroidetes bacterium]|nr:DoxX family protein [Bacteroidota bacterium]
MFIIRKLIKTSDDINLFIIRVVAGFVVLMHGFQKFLGMFGGHGPQSTMDSFNEWFGFPHFLTLLVILSDFFGSLFLIIGVFTRFMAASISAVMIGAIIFVHGRWGFYMNWYAEPRGEGFEFHLLVLAITVVLIISGGGKWSVDYFLHQKIANKN